MKTNLRLLAMTLVSVFLMFFSTSCKKQVDYSGDITQLKSDVLALQKRTDSLVAALAITNNNLLYTNSQIDSVKTKITNILTQINLLNIQITQAGASIIDISAQISSLNQQLASLITQLNIIITQLSITPTTLSDGLVAWYPFTGNANDSSGYNNNGIIYGATLTTGKSGVANTAYQFNGVNNTIDLSSPFFDSKQVNKFTFSTRIKINSTSNAPNIWGKTLFWGEVNFSVGSDNSIRVEWANYFTGNKYSTVKSAANSVKINVWHDIVVVFENSSGKIYLDGIPVTTNLSWIAQGGAILSTNQIESVCNFAQDNNSSKFGLRFVGAQKTAYLNGVIDDFRIYNRVLNENEIKALAKL